MQVPIRNQWSATIMYWVDGQKAQAAISSDALAASEAREARLQDELRRCRDDAAEIRRLERRAKTVPGLDAAEQRMAADDNDLAGSLATPAAVSESESYHDEIRRIEAGHIDQGDAEHFAGIAEHIEHIEYQLADGLRGEAYTADMLDIWSLLATVAIDDGDGYVLETGERFATATEAERADVLPSRIPHGCRIGRERAVDWLRRQ